MKTKTLLIVIIGVFGLFPFIAGCINLEKSYPEKRYFTLDASRVEDVTSTDTEKVITIRRFRVSPKYEGKGLVYRLKEVNYESDFYNEFFISPSSMFTEEIRKRLAGSGLFKYVVEPSSLLDSTYSLEGAVTALYGDYRVNTAPKAVLEIQFFLLQETDSNPKIIYQSQYHKEEPFKNNTPDELVKSWNSAFSQILTEFENDLKEYMSKTGP
jgi:cholesterol transport system auxiliary component